MHSAAPTSPTIERNIKYISKTIMIALVAPTDSVVLLERATSLKNLGKNGIIERGIATVVKESIAFLVKFGAYFCIITSQSAYDMHAHNANDIVITSLFDECSVFFCQPIMNTAIQQITPASVIECGIDVFSSILEKNITNIIFIPIIGVIKLTSPFSAQVKIAMLPIAQNPLASSGCQTIDQSGIVESKNIAGINTNPDRILFITSIDIPLNVSARVAYFARVILMQYNAAEINGKRISGKGSD